MKIYDDEITVTTTASDAQNHINFLDSDKLEAICSWLLIVNKDTTNFVYFHEADSATDASSADFKLEAGESLFMEIGVLTPGVSFVADGGNVIVKIKAKG